VRGGGCLQNVWLIGYNVCSRLGVEDGLLLGLMNQDRTRYQDELMLNDVLVVYIREGMKLDSFQY